MKKIEKITASGGESSMNFTSIPTTYTDLYLVISGRATESDNGTSLRIVFNDDTANQSSRELRAIGSTVASYTVTYAQNGYLAASQSYTNTFGNALLYIPKYRNDKHKISSGDVILPSNTTSEQYIVFSGKKWGSTSAITKISISPSSGNWVQYTTATLYGITNS